MQLTAAQLALYMEKPISNIEAEFSRIPNSSTVRIEELPVGVESKNRYANVLPIPETRVKIALTEEQQQSPSIDDDLKHYINANFVRVRALSMILCGKVDLHSLLIFIRVQKKKAIITLPVKVR